MYALIILTLVCTPLSVLARASTTLCAHCDAFTRAAGLYVIFTSHVNYMVMLYQGSRYIEPVAVDWVSRGSRQYFNCFDGTLQGKALGVLDVVATFT